MSNGHPGRADLPSFRREVHRDHILSPDRRECGPWRLPDACAGKTEQVQIEARGTLTFASGNIVIVGDLCRRVITTTLDPQLERPELREFISNPVATVLADRGAYIAACFTICRAYVVAGRPAPARKLASFEGWSDTVRSALIWLGRADSIDTIETALEADLKKRGHSGSAGSI